MEFLVINLPMLFTFPSTGGFYRKPYSNMVFKIHLKKSAKKENSSLHEHHFVEWKNEGRKPAGGRLFGISAS